MNFLNNIVWSPLEYAQADVLAREAGDEMLSRLDWMTLKPEVIIDAGCGTGDMSAKLQARYPSAHLLPVDFSAPMIQHAKTHHPSLPYLCAEAATLPLPTHSVDLIFANFLLPWHPDIPALLREWRRVLRPQGLLMFSAFGPDTLKEWQAIEEGEVLPQLLDMHDVGDLLLQQGFADPVLDVNYYTMSYRHQEKLLAELQATGMLANADPQHAPVPADDGQFTLTYEIVFAHAFAPEATEEVSPSSDGVVRVPLSQLRERLRSNKA